MLLSKGFRVKRVWAKLANMRKEQDFLPQLTSGGRIIVQSDKSIGSFDPATGEGKLNTKGCYFPHLAIATPYKFPPDFVKACIEALGDTLPTVTEF